MRAPIDRTPRHIPQPSPGKPEKPGHGKLDADGDGSISRAEYLYRDEEGRTPLSKTELKMRGDEFDKIDLNKDGKLSKLELAIDRIREAREEFAEKFDEVFPQQLNEWIADHTPQEKPKPEGPFHNHTDCK